MLGDMDSLALNTTQLRNRNGLLGTRSNAKPVSGEMDPLLPSMPSPLGKGVASLTLQSANCCEMSLIDYPERHKAPNRSASEPTLRMGCLCVTPTVPLLEEGE